LVVLPGNSDKTTVSGEWRLVNGKDRGKVDEDRLARLDTSALEIWTGEGQGRADLFFVL
jgi:hypothetical protein